jgi:hypothetical protein
VTGRLLKNRSGKRFGLFRRREIGVGPHFWKWINQFDSCSTFVNFFQHLHFGITWLVKII